jgi:hypothetical protein
MKYRISNNEYRTAEVKPVRAAFRYSKFGIRYFAVKPMKTRIGEYRRRSPWSAAAQLPPYHVDYIHDVKAQAPLAHSKGFASIKLQMRFCLSFWRRRLELQPENLAASFFEKGGSFL